MSELEANQKTRQRPKKPPQSSSDSPDSHRRTPFCHSWNEGQCQWPLGGAGSATTAALARESIPRPTAPFPAQLDFVPAPPPPQWVSRRVEFLCDNESVVAVLKSGTSRDKNLMVLLRYYAGDPSFLFIYSFISSR